MATPNLDFSSDNAAGVAPEIMAALAAAASGRAGAYGADAWTEKLQRAFSDLFGRDVVVMLVVTGTAANCLALATATPSHGAMLCHRTSHVNEDECGAASVFAHGGKIVPVDGPLGKIDPSLLKAAIATMPRGVVHRSQAASVTLTQATECGTTYKLAEIAALASIAREASLCLHMDGARFGNAVASLRMKPSDITWKAGVDVLSFGATKGGAMGAEALVFFDPAQVRDAEFRRKQAGHLLSKMRYVSAQLLAYVADDLWLRLCGHANDMARRLAEGLGNLPGASLAYPVEANEIFVKLPLGVIARLKAAGARFYEWEWALAEGADSMLVRLVTAFDTRETDVEGFLAVARNH